PPTATPTLTPRVGTARPVEVPDTRPPSSGDSVNAHARAFATGINRDLRRDLYAEGWRQKIEQNAGLDLVRNIAVGSYSPPEVLVHISPSGRIERVQFLRSSGNAQVDDAVRQIVHQFEPYKAFTPDLSLDYDGGIDMPFRWTFNTAVRLFPLGP
ncbi:MAG: TonB family protein, partial [Pseudomonadota bacterium]|nr:TonB family protein [Pseudomonadota bacterium]